MDKEIKSDIVLSVVLCCISLVILWVLIPGQISVPPSLRGKYLSPAFAPRAFTIFLLVMGIGLLIQSAAKAKSRALKTQTAMTEEVPGKPERAFKKHGISAAIWISFCIFLSIVHLIGILIPSILFLGILMVYFGQRRWGVVATVMILIPVVLYLFFHELAKINFPIGLLFD